MSSPATVEVFWTDARQGDPSALVSLLSDAEVAKMRRLVRADDRRRSVVAAALLRTVVGVGLGCLPREVPVLRACACGGAHGKPVIDIAGAPFVSVSHAAQHVVVAVTEVGEVGIDVEAPDSAGSLEDDTLVLAPDEREHVRDGADLLRCWVRKEALVKATGDGLTIDLAGVRVSPPRDAPFLLSYDGRPGLVASLHDLHLPGAAASAVACVAVLGRGPLQIRVEERSQIGSSP